MFGWKRKQHRLEQQVKELEQRLEHNSKIIEEDHHDLVELKAMSTAAKSLIDALQTKIELLESRQQQLREGFKAAVDVPQQPLAAISITPPLAFPGIPITDHICNSVKNPPQLCAYCCSTRRYYGAECGCSPDGYPHSENCKAWPGPHGEDQPASIGGGVKSFPPSYESLCCSKCGGNNHFNTGDGPCLNE